MGILYSIFADPFVQMWASPDLAAQSIAHRFVEETRRWEQPSDHIPLITDFTL